MQEVEDQMHKTCFVFGTRPEAIKLAPLVHKFKKMSDFFDVSICITSQHQEMLQQVMNLFDMSANMDLNLMRPNQSLEYITSRAIEKLGEYFKEASPDLVLVQGDTTTVMAASLAAFYQKIPVAHIEAGLRSHNQYSPFPEEINRKMVSHIANYHFAPTQGAKENLLNEGISEDKIWVVGNTVIDALFIMLDSIKNEENEYRLSLENKNVDFTKKLILVTGHRRENFGAGMQNICKALLEISNEDVEIVYPVHLNPNVRKPVKELLGSKANIHLIEPLPYDKLIYLMNQSHLILTDSGGIQEEAPSLGKPVLVMREVTERMEGVEAGTAKLVGTDKEIIISETYKLLTDDNAYHSISSKNNPYGDGNASIKICDIIKQKLKEDSKK